MDFQSEICLSFEFEKCCLTKNQSGLGLFWHLKFRQETFWHGHFITGTFWHGDFSAPLMFRQGDNLARLAYSVLVTHLDQKHQHACLVDNQYNILIMPHKNGFWNRNSNNAPKTMAKIFFQHSKSINFSIDTTLGARHSQLGHLATLPVRTRGGITLRHEKFLSFK